MPIIRGDNLSRFPEAASIAGLGITRLAAGESAGHDLHYHDGEELWVVVDGKIRAWYDGREVLLQAGDTLLTLPGEEHEILEVLDDATIVWLEQNLQGRMRRGHLHRPQDPFP